MATIEIQVAGMEGGESNATHIIRRRIIYNNVAKTCLPVWKVSAHEAGTVGRNRPERVAIGMMRNNAFLPPNRIFTQYEK